MSPSQSAAPSGGLVEGASNTSRPRRVSLSGGLFGDDSTTSASQSTEPSEELSGGFSDTSRPRRVSLSGGLFGESSSDHDDVSSQSTEPSEELSSGFSDNATSQLKAQPGFLFGRADNTAADRNTALSSGQEVFGGPFSAATPRRPSPLRRVSVPSDGEDGFVLAPSGADTASSDLNDVTASSSTAAPSSNAAPSGTPSNASTPQNKASSRSLFGSFIGGPSFGSALSDATTPSSSPTTLSSVPSFGQPSRIGSDTRAAGNAASRRQFLSSNGGSPFGTPPSNAAVASSSPTSAPSSLPFNRSAPQGMAPSGSPFGRLAGGSPSGSAPAFSSTLASSGALFDASVSQSRAPSGASGGASNSATLQSTATSGSPFGRLAGGSPSGSAPPYVATPTSFTVDDSGELVEASAPQSTAPSGVSGGTSNTATLQPTAFSGCHSVRCAGQSLFGSALPTGSRPLFGSASSGAATTSSSNGRSLFGSAPSAAAAAPSSNIVSPFTLGVASPWDWARFSIATASPSNPLLGSAPSSAATTSPPAAASSGTPSSTSLFGVSSNTATLQNTAAPLPVSAPANGTWSCASDGTWSYASPNAAISSSSNGVSSLGSAPSGAATASSNRVSPFATSNGASTSGPARFSAVTVPTSYGASTWTSGSTPSSAATASSSAAVSSSASSSTLASRDGSNAPVSSNAGTASASTLRAQFFCTKLPSPPKPFCSPIVNAPNMTTWKPTTTSNYDGADMVKLLVGSEERPLLAHKSYLCLHSDFFKTALKREWLEGQTRSVKLPDEQPDIVAQYLDYTYGRGLPTASKPSQDPVTGRVYEVLTELFALGERLLDTTVRNPIINEIIRFTTAHTPEGIHYPGARAVNNIYNCTTAASPARRLMVELYVTAGRKDWFTEDLHPAFVMDLRKQLMLEVQTSDLPCRSRKGSAKPDYYRIVFG